MGKTGRNAFVATDLVRYGNTGRLSPPANLGEAERRAFLDLVCSVPTTQFAACDLPCCAPGPRPWRYASVWLPG